MIVVNSSVWIDYFNGTDTRETALLDNIIGRQAVVIGDFVMTEVLQGSREDREIHFAQAVSGNAVLVADGRSCQHRCKHPKLSHSACRWQHLVTRRLTC